MIVKTSALGDIVQTFPVLHYLKNKYPEAKIDWVVEEPFASLLRAHPQVNQVFTLSSKKWRKKFFSLETLGEIGSLYRALRPQKYQVAFDLQGNIKSGLIMAALSAFTKVGFARKSVAEWPNLLFTRQRYNVPEGKNIREDYLSVVAQHFGERSSPLCCSKVELTLGEAEKGQLEALFKGACSPVTLFCLGSAWPNKRLSLEKALQLLSHCRGTFWFIWGDAFERESVEYLAKEVAKRKMGSALVLPKLSLPLLQRVMARVERVIAMDSLPLHLAGTTATETIGIFGPSAGEKFNPLGHRFLQGSCPYGVNFCKRCPQLRTCATGACMEQVPLEHL